MRETEALAAFKEHVDDCKQGCERNWKREWDTFCPAGAVHLLALLEADDDLKRKEN